MRNFVQTVLGPVDPAQLGRVLHHEHLASLVPGPWLSGGRAKHDGIATGSEAQQHVDDQVTHGVAALSGLQRLGFDTVVDLSPYGVVGRSDLGENLGILEQISRKSGVHIILGSSTYLDAFSPDWVEQTTIEQLTARFIADVETGIGSSSFRAGVLGEQATSLEVITPHEEISLRAAARAHLATGVAMTTHTTHGTMALEQLRILREENADLSRVVIGHMDIQPDLDYVMRVLDTGVGIAFDTIGKQFWDFVLEPLPADLAEGEFAKRAYYRSDRSRALRLVELVDRGYAEQLYLSLDLTGAEVSLNPTTHGQWGYGYLGGVFIPEALTLGLPPGAVQTMLRDNPVRLLTRKTAK